MSAKIWKHKGGTKPTWTNDMKFGPMKCLSRLKRSTRRAERRLERDVIDEHLTESGKPSRVLRSSMPRLDKATASGMGVTGYLFNNHRVYLE